MIKTNFDYPPIPVRDFDWSAYSTKHAPDYDYQGAEDGYVSCGGPVGHGPTELDAIFDLLEQLEDE